MAPMERRDRVGWKRGGSVGYRGGVQFDPCDADGLLCVDANGGPVSVGRTIVETVRWIVQSFRTLATPEWRRCGRIGLRILSSG